MLFHFIIPQLVALQFNTNEKNFAAEICKGNKEALSEFQELFSDELYYISSKFNNRGFSQDVWEYRTKKGYSISVSDDVADTYIWLIKIAINKSCLYRGDNGATFSTYIRAVLNGSYTFKDWLKWRTGVTGYIPKSIKALTEDHRKVFVLLRQKKNDDEICKKLNLTFDEYIFFYSEIESELIRSNQIDLLEKPKFISMDAAVKNGEDNISPSLQIPSNEFMNPSINADYLMIKRIIDTVIEGMTSAERRLLLLYWGEGQTVSDIYIVFNHKDFNEYLVELSIDKEKDIYNVLTSIIKKSTHIAEDTFPKEVSDYQLTENKMKMLLKTYFHNFEIG